jgi:hypothetical protein
VPQVKACKYFQFVGGDIFGMITQKSFYLYPVAEPLNRCVIRQHLYSWYRLDVIIFSVLHICLYNFFRLWQTLRLFLGTYSQSQHNYDQHASNFGSINSILTHGNLLDFDQFHILIIPTLSGTIRILATELMLHMLQFPSSYFSNPHNTKTIHIWSSILSRFSKSNLTMNDRLCTTATDIHL